MAIGGSVVSRRLEFATREDRVHRRRGSFVLEKPARDPNRKGEEEERDDLLFFAHHLFCALSPSFEYLVDDRAVPGEVNRALDESGFAGVGLLAISNHLCHLWIVYFHEPRFRRLAYTWPLRASFQSQTSRPRKTAPSHRPVLCRRRDSKRLVHRPSTRLDTHDNDRSTCLSASASPAKYTGTSDVRRGGPRAGRPEKG